MRMLILLTAGAALLSGAAMAGEIVILNNSNNRSLHRADRARDAAVLDDFLLGDSIIIIERHSSREEELGRRDPGLEARRAARKANLKRRSKDHPPPTLDEFPLDGTFFLDSPVPFVLGRGDPGREAARAANDARRMRLEK